MSQAPIRNPVTALLVTALSQPDQLKPMVRDGLREAGGMILESLGLSLQREDSGRESDRASTEPADQKGK